MASSRVTNLFIRTRYSLGEEDRVVNAMSLALQRLPDAQLRACFNRLSIPLAIDDQPEFDDHVAFGPESIVDLVVTVPARSIAFCEAKVVSGQLDDPEQALRYWKILEGRPEPQRSLLLVSPDRECPSSVNRLRALNTNVRVTWLSWGDIGDAFAGIMDQIDEPVSKFLVGQFVAYIEELGLLPKALAGDTSAKIEPQLRLLLSSVATEMVLLHIYQHGRGYVTAIARDHGLGTGETQRALARLEKGQVLVKQRAGGVVFYSFDNRNPLVPALLDLIRVAYRNIPEDQRRLVFTPKSRPSGARRRATTDA